MTELPQLDPGLAVLVFNPGDDPIDCLNKAMAFMPLFKMEESLCNKFKGGKYRVMLVQEIREMLQVRREIMQVDKKGLLNDIIVKEKMLLVQARGSGKILDEEQLAFLADPGIPDAKAVLMANLSNYSSDILFE
ncbi:hypothetical protein Tco_0023017, partial [Tanacetum coccineum]